MEICKPSVGFAGLQLTVSEQHFELLPEFGYRFALGILCCAGATSVPCSIAHGQLVRNVKWEAQSYKDTARFYIPDYVQHNSCRHHMQHG